MLRATVDASPGQCGSLLSHHRHAAWCPPRLHVGSPPALGISCERRLWKDPLERTVKQRPEGGAFEALNDPVRKSASPTRGPSLSLLALRVRVLLVL